MKQLNKLTIVKLFLFHFKENKDTINVKLLSQLGHFISHNHLHYAN